MTRTPRRRHRVLVPFEVGSLLRAPYGWTNRMRRDEGYPQHGSVRPVHIGFWRNVLMALVVYGPMVVGAVVGSHIWGGWPGAGLGLLVTFFAGCCLFLTALPVVAVVRRPDR